MTPPGDGLEFHGSPDYRRQASAAPEMDEAVKEAICNRPHAGIVVAGLARERVLEFGGSRLVLFYTRKGQAIGLLAVLHEEQADLVEAKRAEIKRTFGPGGAW